jgi:hypothetical protein
MMDVNTIISLLSALVAVLQAVYELVGELEKKEKNWQLVSAKLSELQIRHRDFTRSARAFVNEVCRQGRKVPPEFISARGVKDSILKCIKSLEEIGNLEIKGKIRNRLLYIVNIIELSFHDRFLRGLKTGNTALAFQGIGAISDQLDNVVSWLEESCKRLDSPFQIENRGPLSRFLARARRVLIGHNTKPAQESTSESVDQPVQYLQPESNGIVARGKATLLSLEKTTSDPKASRRRQDKKPMVQLKR